MKKLIATLLLLPALAWADLAKHAEYAAEQILVEENVLTVYLTANDEGRLTILFWPPGPRLADRGRARTPQCRARDPWHNACQGRHRLLPHPLTLKPNQGNPMQELQPIIEEAFERRAEINPRNADPQVKDAVMAVIDLLDMGELRVAERTDGQNWVTHQWIKKAVLLSFRLEDNAFIKGGYTNYYDKVPSKFADFNSRDFRECGFRVVPPAAARKGAYIGKNVVLMPSYVNIGAYVDDGTMVDTWATVGSCAQIGKNVHLSGGVGIGGVLEPVQAGPTIIGDNCFIGARSEVVEGVVVEDNCVISMGVYIGQSTKIYDRETGEVHYGRVPAGSVVVSGNLPSKDGKYSLYCAVIVKKVDEKTLSKVGINELLRGI
jgi:2,3,4,5-tetrahydropyridine-2,6-dicarboxylate N-succinyltransferase